jgi:VIT1/CCC1 family predicted Fe2+/Mn2+ transporter
MEIKMNLEVADMYDLELILFLRKKGIIEEIPNEIEEQEELPEPGQIKIKDIGQKRTVNRK